MKTFTVTHTGIQGKGAKIKARTARQAVTKFIVGKHLVESGKKA